ncbi:TKL protein kinase [Saprolegnia parasitica CBS 223.65]|uniref:TKL protein kinase n=1 Tax=Saprolegnia parasitica (strain CBS 223.65) TaxID=695850 RepID=A0A067CH59_SAPPC|nr:TKL protein kinase [Saprolegnia parasitica CBS 223.65]KDO29828.1 TKL protein kinase [Saprolegnia parasitica CBS 223.65]|eukprot:XP_012199456.1 TKL protein kinase [Saprolegnia parasitica CBS 223.65]
MSCASDNVLTTCAACDAGVPCLRYSTASTCAPVRGGVCVSPAGDCPYQCYPSAISNGVWQFTYKNDPKTTDVGGYGPIGPIKNYTVPSSVRYERALVIPNDNMPRSAVKVSGGPNAGVGGNPLKSISPWDPAFLGSSVTTLSLEGLNLMSSYPTVPATVTDVTISNCQLTAIPAWALPSSLAVLALPNNKLETLPAIGSSLYDKLANLKNLDLSRNALSTFDLQLKNLKALDLSNNQFTTIPSAVYSLSGLASLNLDGNPLSGAISKDQFTILNAIPTLKLPAVAGSCPSSSGLQTTTTSGNSICVVGASSSSSTGLIVGIVAGVAVLLAAIGGFFWYRKRHAAADTVPETTFNDFEPSYPLPGSRRRQPTDLDLRGSSASTNPSKTTLARGRGSSNNVMSNNSPVYKDLLLQTRSNPTHQRSSIVLQSALNPAIVTLDENDMVYTRTLGKGAKGVVWLASYAGDVVAVKKMVQTAPDADRQEALCNLVAEANLLLTLRHAHIIQLIGVVTDRVNEIAVVLEYMDLGDLREMLMKKKPSPTFDWQSLKGTYALHVAKGLAYLHGKNPPLIHRDIKARNILVDSQKGAKICDFGESRLRSYQETMTSNVGTARWIAPEVLLNDDYSEKADIYSFGVLLSELDTHDVPYSDVNLDERVIVQRVAVGQLRPKFSANCPEKLRRLANHCMQADPALRPDANKIAASLADLLESY